MDARLEALGSLLLGSRVLTLGVVVDGAPVLGLLPFAVSPGSSTLWVHASRLARHTRGLMSGASAAVLVHAAGVEVERALEVPRLTLDVDVTAPEKDGAAYATARALYLARFPEAEVTFSLGDFRLYGLVARRGRLVLGFGRAFDVSVAELERAGTGQ